ncbi:MFS transporter [Kitasatospora saccharophila]|uniref:MFS transporter n=1 Tax=Kitasatospora saccharophila TaxID=407973 RepID=UPI0036423524
MRAPGTPATSTAPDRPARTGTGSAPHGAGFWLVAAAFTIAMAFNAVPSPLYPIYQQRDGFATLTVTVVFAVFALGVAASLVVAGHVSDWIGRKRVLLPALGLELVADVLFLASPSLPAMIAARLLGGLGVGLITATATAHLHDLHRAHRPHAGPDRFETVSTGANLGGLAVGPLVAGALAQYVDHPLRVPYLVFGVLLLLAILAVAAAPETVEVLASRPSYRPQRVSTDHGDRTAYVAAAGAGFAAFAINGVYTALSAGFLLGVLHEPGHLLAGVAACVLMAAAVVAQTAANPLGARTRRALGLGLGAAGLVLLAVGIRSADLTVFLAAGIVAGAGSGILTKSVVGTVAAMAEPGKRGEAISGLFLFCYAGMSLPAIGVGLLSRCVSLTTAVYVFSAVLVAVLAGAALLSFRSSRASRASRA